MHWAIVADILLCLQCKLNIATMNPINMRALVEDKLSQIQKKLDFDLFANVAKVLAKHEISKSPGAQKALDAEWEKLLNKKTWGQSKVKECRAIVDEAKRKG